MTSNSLSNLVASSILLQNNARLRGGDLGLFCRRIGLGTREGERGRGNEGGGTREGERGRGLLTLLDEYFGPVDCPQW